MKVKSAWFPRNLPGRIMIVTNEGRHFVAPNIYREIRESDLTPVPAYDRIRPEQFWDRFDRVPDYTLRFYGLEVEE